jgi:hypothetical protein
LSGALTALGILVGLAVVAYAVTLPGITVRGLVLGGVLAGAGALTWTATDHPVVIWLALAGLGVLGLAWGRPYLRNLRQLPGLGTAWTGLAYWLLGIAGALLVTHTGVAAQRLAYAGVFTLTALAVLARRETDLSTGVIAAVGLVLGALLLAGAGNVFHAVHAVPNADPSTLAMRNRFWGGPLLYYHPNSMAGLAVAVAVRIGPDRAFAAWRRLAAVLLAGLFVTLTGSRTALVFAGGAAALHALLLYREAATVAGFPRYKRKWIVAGTPFVVLALAVVIAGGVVRSRFGGGDVTSGRVDTWRQVATDWRHAGPAEKLLGDARTSRAVVTRLDDGAPPQGPRRQLNTDNAAVGAVRRGGVLGGLAFLVGVLLLVWHALARRRAAWFTIAALSLVPPTVTEDWLLGGTNGVLWLLLLAGEAWVTRSPGSTMDGAGEC